jgi:hypothetical protein
MSYAKKVWFVVLTSCSLSFCASRFHQFSFPQTIAAAYYDKTTDLKGEIETGCDLYIELEMPLIKGVVLDNLYFQNQVSAVEQQSSTIFVAHFDEELSSQDFILDSDTLKEYGNHVPVITKSKFELLPTEAVLEYKNQNKTFYYTIKAIKERPMIANPSGIKPKN